MAKIVNIESWSKKRLNLFNMKTNHPTDQIFREKLGDYASDPPMHIWEQIDQNRSSKKRGWLFFRRNWGMAVLGLLILGSASYIMYENENSNATLISEDNIEEYQNTNDSDKKETEPILGELNLKNKTTEVLASESLEVNETQKTVVKTKNNSFSKPLGAKQVLDNQYTNSKNNLSSEIERTLKIDQNKTGKINLSIEPIEEKTTLEVNEKQEIAIENRTDNTALSSLNFDVPEIKFEAPQFEIPEPDIRGYKRFLRKKGDPKKGCPRIEKGKKYNMYVDVLVGPDVAVRNLRTKTPDAVNYLDARETTESYRYAYSSGLRLSFLNRQGFALRTGLMYNQIAEKFDYYNGNEQHITITTIENQDGTVTRDTSIEFGERFITTFNRFHIIDIPLQFGYEVHYGKWAYGVNAGVNFNILFHKKGEFLNPVLKPQTYDTGNPNAYPAFRKNLGLSFSGSINLNYELTDNIRLVFEPHFKYYKNSFTRSEYTLDQQYFSAGILTGLRMKF